MPLIHMPRSLTQLVDHLSRHTYRVLAQAQLGSPMHSHDLLPNEHIYDVCVFTLTSSLVRSPNSLTCSFERDLCGLGGRLSGISLQMSQTLAVGTLCFGEQTSKQHAYKPTVVEMTQGPAT